MSGSLASLPPTRIISWQQVVLDADPEWYLRFQKPWIYQYSNGRRFYQQVPYPNTTPNDGLVDNGGFICFSNAPRGTPTSAAGLLPGRVWNNGGFACVAPGTVADGVSAPLDWIGLNAQTLLFFGALNVPTAPTAPGSYLLWSNSGFLCLPPFGLENNGGVLQLTAPIAAWPTSIVGLSPGDLWSNGLVVCVVQPTEPVADVAPVLLNNLDAMTLLAIGGVNLPLADPGNPGQLWNNGGVVCISSASGLSNNGGVLTLSAAVAAGWPSSRSGLLTGDLWNNGLVVSVVGPTSPNPLAAPVMFGVVTAEELLALSGANLPTTDPDNPGQLWNNGGIVCVS